jgi:hypothetical protein
VQSIQVVNSSVGGNSQGSRFALIELDIPMSCGPIICGEDESDVAQNTRHAGHELERRSPNIPTNSIT